MGRWRGDAGGGTLAGSGAIVETGGGGLMPSGDGLKFTVKAVISGRTIGLGTYEALGGGEALFKSLELAQRIDDPRSLTRWPVISRARFAAR
jgi:hypothetical protein